MLRCKRCADRGGFSVGGLSGGSHSKTLRQGAAIRHCGKALWKGTIESTAVRCFYKVLRQGTMARTAARRRCGKILRQGTTARRQALCCIRQDTATRHCGKTLRQGNAAGAAERPSGRHCGFTCGKTPRQNTAAGTTARRHHDKTPRQKYTAARNYNMTLWQETATRDMTLRHATATKPKKEGVGGLSFKTLCAIIIP